LQLDQSATVVRLAVASFHEQVKLGIIGADGEANQTKGGYHSREPETQPRSGHRSPLMGRAKDGHLIPDLVRAFATR